MFQEEADTSQRKYCPIFIYQNENNKGRSFDSQKFSHLSGLEAKYVSLLPQCFFCRLFRRHFRYTILKKFNWEDSKLMFFSVFWKFLVLWDSLWKRNLRGLSNLGNLDWGPSWDFTICMNTAKTLKSLSVKERKKKQRALTSVTSEYAMPPPPVYRLFVPLSLHSDNFAESSTTTGIRRHSDNFWVIECSSWKIPYRYNRFNYKLRFTCEEVAVFWLGPAGAGAGWDAQACLSRRDCSAVGANEQRRQWIFCSRVNCHWVLF